MTHNIVWENWGELLEKEFLPGSFDHYLYRTWYKMIRRCICSYDDKYDDYGGRGITVSRRWLMGEDGLHPFFCFIMDMGPRPDKHTLDRIDNDGGYSKENCRWATASQQVLNQRRKPSARNVLSEETKKMVKSIVF